MLLRLGIASKFALLLTSSIYLSLTRHIYCCASAEQINLFCTRLLRIFETELSITLI